MMLLCLSDSCSVFCNVMHRCRQFGLVENCPYAKKRIGVLRSLLLVSLLRALVEVPGAPPNDAEDNNLCAVRPLSPRFGCGSHMQQGPRHLLGASTSRFTVSFAQEGHLDLNIGATFPQTCSPRIRFETRDQHPAVRKNKSN